MEIAQALATFLVQIEADGRSPHTRRQYARHIRALERWLIQSGKSRDVTTITHQAIAEFLVAPLERCRPDGNPRKPTTLNAVRTSVRCFFGHLAATGTIESNPARLVRRARCSPPPPRAI